MTNVDMMAITEAATTRATVRFCWRKTSRVSSSASAPSARRPALARRIAATKT